MIALPSIMNNVTKWTLQQICEAPETVKVYCVRNPITWITQLNLAANITSLVFGVLDFLLLGYLAIETARSLRMLAALKTQRSTQ